MINLVIDVSNLIYASYFVFADKVSWWMVYGVLNSILSLVNEEQADTLTLVYGSKIINKKTLFPMYRTGRTVKIDFDQKQFNRLLEICSKLNLCQLKAEGLEADQLLAAYVNSIDECVIISEDKDFFQLLTDKKILKGKKRGTWDEKRVKTEFGLKEASLFADFQTLVGDPTDRVPRIVSDKDATFLVNLKGDLSKWLLTESPNYTNIPKRIIERLQNNYDQVQINYYLVNLRNEKLEEDMFIPSNLDLDFVKDKLYKMGIKTFLNRFNEFEHLVKLNNTKIRGK